jgi:hypothetical protein
VTHTLIDRSDESVAYFEDYYSVAAPTFTALTEEAAARSWASICRTDWIDKG